MLTSANWTQQLTVYPQIAGVDDEYGNPTLTDGAPVVVLGVLQQTERTESGEGDTDGHAYVCNNVGVSYGLDVRAVRSLQSLVI